VWKDYHRTITFGIHHDLSLNSTLAIETPRLVKINHKHHYP
jgi:hypothetical protein